MKQSLIASFATLLTCFSSSFAYAQEPDKTREFAGLSFGVGISATFDLGENDRVSAAEVVNDIVRVTDKDNVRARIMLESHYFFKPEKAFPLTGTESEKWGYGPFIALQPGTDEIIESIGFGLMVGFRRDEDSDQSFNIGLGVAYDPNTQTLGADVIDGQPLPAGETDVRFLEQDQVGLLLLTSFSF